MRFPPQDLPASPECCTSDRIEQRRTADPISSSPQRATQTAWLFLALIVLVTAGLRVRLLGIPFERDEGEYAYIAQLILQGEAPFTQAYTMKYPGVPYVYAAFLALFGQTDVAVHLGLLIVNAISVVLVFLLGKRLFNPLIGLIAASSFGLLSFSRTTLGFTANTEHFVLLPMLAATLLLLRAVEQKQWPCLLASGFLFGVAVLMKQHAAIFAAFGVIYLLILGLRRDGRSLKRALLHLFLFSTAVAFPLALLSLYIWVNGAFAPFWFWTFTYPRHYVSMAPVEIGTARLIYYGGLQVVKSIGLYSLAFVGGAAIVRSHSVRPRALFLTLFACFSFLAVCPGLHFRPHYFLFFIPAVSLLAAVGAVALGQLCRRFASPNRIVVLISLLALVGGISQQYRYYFLVPPSVILNATYARSHFVEMKELALYIRDHSLPDDRIAVLGSEPEIYFYARRRGATRFIYTYPLMEPQPYALQMQQDMIAEMERERPRYIVLLRSNESWYSFVGPNAPQLILQWPAEYVASRYRRVLVADMLSWAKTEYHWGEEAVSYQPSSDCFVVLYERLNDTEAHGR
jgi:hypothetical protein